MPTTEVTKPAKAVQPTEMTYKGHVYKLSKPTVLQQAQFQRWLEQRARDAIGREVDLEPARIAQLDASLTDSIATGQYEWGGELCMRALRTPSGLAKLTEILLADQGVTYPMALEMVQQQFTETAARLLQEVNYDPGVMAATLELLGLPPNYFTQKRKRAKPTLKKHRR